MAAKISKRIIIDVKNGDVFDEMRLLKSNGEKGRSNTGTYFLCSEKDFLEYNYFFSKCKNYYLDINKIKEYQIVFWHFYNYKKDMYLDRMENFNNYWNQIYDLQSTRISGM